MQYVFVAPRDYSEWWLNTPLSLPKAKINNYIDKMLTTIIEILTKPVQTDDCLSLVIQHAQAEAETRLFRQPPPQSRFCDL